jgi:hypothetical protein
MTCKNCGHPIEDWQNFCGHCGAKVIRNRLTPKILAEQVNQEILAIDNRFFRTLYALFRAPEDVIVGYINGVRKKYQDVLQYFAIALTITGFQVLAVSYFFPEAFEVDSALNDFLENQPGQEKNPFKDLSYQEATDFQGLGYILTLPLYALSTWIAYRVIGDKRYNLTEHFVINLYYSAQSIILFALLILISVIFGMDYLTGSLITLVPLYLYYYFVLKRVFNDSYLLTFAKFMLVQAVNVVIYIVIALLVFLGFVVYMLVFGGEL